MISKTLVELISSTLKDRKDKHGWDKGKFKDIQLLSADEKGEIGEMLIEHLLNQIGVLGTTRAGSLDRTEKHWDIKANDMTIEVKTATLGRNNNRFQHESIEKDRNYDVLLFLDITPNDVYLSWYPKREIKWKELQRRATGIQYKRDLTLSKIQENKVESLADVRLGYEAVRAKLTPKS